MMKLFPVELRGGFRILLSMEQQIQQLADVMMSIMFLWSCSFLEDPNEETGTTAFNGTYWDIIHYVKYVFHAEFTGFKLKGIHFRHYLNSNKTLHTNQVFSVAGGKKLQSSIALSHRLEGSDSFLRYVWVSVLLSCTPRKFIDALVLGSPKDKGCMFLVGPQCCQIWGAHDHRLSPTQGLSKAELVTANPKRP